MPHLSKAWSIQSSHVPTFTGGPILYTPNLLVLPVRGDLALISSQGTQHRLRLRGKGNNNKEEGDSYDDDDDDGVDHDAITAYALANNNNNTTLVTCSFNSVLRQYNISTQDASPHTTSSLNWGKSGHSLPVTHLKFHSSNIFVATGSVDGTVRIWDVRGRFVTHVFRPYQVVTGTPYSDDRPATLLRVTSLQWMPSIEQLIVAIGRDDGSICIHDLRMEQPSVHCVLNDHVSAVTCMEWTDDGDTNNHGFFVTAGRDSVLNVWSHQYERLHTLPVYEQVEGMVLLRSKVADATTTDRFQVVTAGSKGRVRLWNWNKDKLVLAQEQPIAEAFGEDRGGYLGLYYAHDKEQLLVADAEHNITFLSNLETQRTIVGHNDEILDLKLVSNKQQMVVATNSAKVRLFDFDFSCHTLDGHSATVLCVDVSPCGRYVATCGKDKQMRVWNLDHRACVALAEGHTEAIGSTALSKKIGRYDVMGKAATNGGGAFVVTASVDRTLKRWNWPGSSVLDECAIQGEPYELEVCSSVKCHDKDVNIVSISPNDALIATGSQDKTVKLWNATDLSLKATLQGHRRGVWDCQFSPFDRVVATCSGDRTIKLWSLSDYSCVRGLQLASSGADGLVKIWTIRTNECETTMDGHEDKVWALDVSSSGDLLVSGGADSKIVLWGDTTKEDEVANQAEVAEAILLDQRLANHLRHNEYSKALEISLQRDKPHQTLKVLTAILEIDLEAKSVALHTLKELAKLWSTEQLQQILRYCRDWNTRARNSFIAMSTVKAILMVVPASKLLNIDGVPEILSGILPYAERHFDRMDRLYANSYLLDFILCSMGSMESSADHEFVEWETKSKLVLPPKQMDGRVQVGGKTLVGAATTLQLTTARTKLVPVEYLDDNSDEEEEVITIGESDSASEGNDSL